MLHEHWLDIFRRNIIFDVRWSEIWLNSPDVWTASSLLPPCSGQCCCVAAAAWPLLTLTSISKTPRELELGTVLRNRVDVWKISSDFYIIKPPLHHVYTNISVVVSVTHQSKSPERTHQRLWAKYACHSYIMLKVISGWLLGRWHVKSANKSLLILWQEIDTDHDCHCTVSQLCWIKKHMPGLNWIKSTLQTFEVFSFQITRSHSDAWNDPVQTNTKC